MVFSRSCYLFGGVYALHWGLGLGDTTWGSFGRQCHVVLCKGKSKKTTFHISFSFIFQLAKTLRKRVR